MSGGFQTQVYNQPAIGVAGNRASLNVMTTFDAGPGGLVADVGGVVVGNFAWVVSPTDPNGTGQVATQVRGSGIVAGLVYNDTQAMNTQFLSDATMVIPQGFGLGLATNGDFDVINAGTTEATIGMKAYATYGTGAITFAPTGTPAAGATSTGSSIAAETFSVTGSIAGDILTVSAVASGTIVNGAAITGTGVATGNAIAAQLTGTTGGVGTYLLKISQQGTVTSETISGTYGLLTIGTVTAGSFVVGQPLATTSGVSAGTYISQLLSGTGGNGSTYAVNNTQTVASNPINSVGNVETKWQAGSAGQPSAIIKISSWVGPLG